MAAMDRINERHGPGTVALASAGHFAENRIWSMRQALKTPDYMARWSDIPTALA